MRAFLMIALMLATPVFAQPYTTKEVRKGLVRNDKAEITILLPEYFEGQNIDALTAAFSQQPYFGAVAVTLDENLTSNANTLVGNHHSIEAANKAALALCNKARASGSRKCQIAVEIRPAKSSGDPLALSLSATDIFYKEFRRAKAPKALATSASTGKIGLGFGEAAEHDALAACAQASGAEDCLISILN